jgi:4-diphosphocytidyl-2-C-methyl-D-erythritol kinase
LVLFPNCKINLGLRVADKRADAYHNLHTIFFPLPLRDAAEITVCSTRKEHLNDFELTISGETIPGDLSNNLCARAYHLLKAEHPKMPAVRMHLLKAIPIGAGLGGGSSDGAFTLMLLNEVLKLNLSTEKLLHYALQLGSDCPFFIINKPVYATGRGEIMEEINVDLGDYYFVLINPGIHINTAEAFEGLTQRSANESPYLPDVVKNPVHTWKEHLVNDFETTVFKKHPPIAQLKTLLYDAGAEYASMTGTGSTVYGIFHKSKKTGNLKTAKNHRVYILNKSH